MKHAFLFSFFYVQTAQKIFGGEIKVHVLLFNSKKATDAEKLRDEFKTAAMKFRGKVRSIFQEKNLFEKAKSND